MRIELTIGEEHLGSFTELIASAIVKQMGGAQRQEPYTLAEAAEKVGVSPKTLERRIKAGDVPRVPNVGKVLIPAWAIADLLAGHRPQRNQCETEKDV